MSKTNSRIPYIHRRRKAAAVALGASLLTWAATTAPLSAQQSPKGTSLGEFNLRSFAQVQFEYNSKRGSSEYRLTRPVLTSPRYDFAAGNMQLTLRGGRTRTGLATGAVQITVRNRATDGSTKQTIQLSCDQARYTAGATRDKGRIDLEGNVRSKTYTSGFDGPITLNGAKGYVEFLDAENTRVQIDQGTSSFTPIEPAPAPRKK